MAIQFIDTRAALDTILPDLKKASQLAIDLEFDKNYYRYGFNLCLMQIFDGKHCYLIDPLSSDLDIRTIFPLLEDPSTEKVAFAFGEDLRLLHSLGCFPKNIYDLDNAISLLNYPPASLTNHLKNILGIDTGKSSQMSNWYQRPLSEDQIKYAAEDVNHLIKLKNVLAEEAEKKNVSHWIREENSLMDTEDHSETENNDIIKEKDKIDLTESQWHIYIRLMEVREEIAERLNKPSFQVIKKDIFKQIAKEPKRLNRWTSTRGIYKRLRTDEMKKKMMDVVKNAVREAEEKGLSDTEPANKPLSSEQRDQFRLEREKINRAKAEFFTPIKEQIQSDYGKEVSTFLFSNRIIAELVTSDRLNLTSYKRTLIENYSDDLDLDPRDYLNL